MCDDGCEVNAGATLRLTLPGYVDDGATSFTLGSNGPSENGKNEFRSNPTLGLVDIPPVVVTGGIPPLALAVLVKSMLFSTNELLSYG